MWTWTFAFTEGQIRHAICLWSHWWYRGHGVQSGHVLHPAPVFQAECCSPGAETKRESSWGRAASGQVGLQCGHQTVEHLKIGLYFPFQKKFCRLTCVFVCHIFPDNSVLILHAVKMFWVHRNMAVFWPFGSGYASPVLGSLAHAWLSNSMFSATEE